MLTMQGLRDNAPDTCTVWRKSENIAATTDHRLKSPTYESTAGIPCWLQVLSAKEKALLGFMAVQVVARLWIADMAYANTGRTGDTVTVRGEAYQVNEWISYNEDFVPVEVRHVEAMCERLPTMPEGLS